MTIRPDIFILASALFLAAPTAALSQTAVDEFERGNAHYREGRFEKAVSAYETILKQGLASPALFFNVGNAHYRLGKVGPAVLAYERALRLQPNDPDIKHNLELATLRTVDRIEPLPELFFIQWLHTLSTLVPLDATAWLFAFCWIGLFGALSAVILLKHPSLLLPLRAAALTLATLSILFGALAATQIVESRSHNDAIVMAAIATTKTSPDTHSLDAFVIHEGLKVKLSDAVGEWVKIILPDGKVGWIRSRDCERI